MNLYLKLILIIYLFFVLGIYSGYAQDDFNIEDACKNMAVELEIPESDLSDYIENCTIEIQDENLNIEESNEEEEIEESEESEENEA